MSRSHQRGIAVVFAMGIVAFATVAAVAIMASQSTWARENELYADDAQAQSLAYDAVAWARSVLRDDRRTSTADHLGEPWALRLAPMPIPNGSAAGHLEDQQGLFNLNNLVRDGRIVSAQLERFRKLLALLDLPASLADSLADWVDADSEARPRHGAEDDYYLALPTPYLAANRPLTDVRELALVRGFDANVLERLSPYVTALPKATAVNVNTAPPAMLAAMIDGIRLDDARTLASQRERVYFRDTSDFLARLPQGATAVPDQISTSSDYFVAYAHVKIGTAEARTAALLERGRDGWPAVLWRKRL